MIQTADTAERILTSASRLFSLQGVGTTSIRAITRDAGTNLNSIHYHFGSRRGLLGAVWERAMGPIQRERAKSWSDLPVCPTTQQLLDSLYGPILRRGLAPPRSSRARSLLVAHQIRQDPSEDARAILAAHEDDLAATYSEALARALGCTIEGVDRTLVFVNGAAWDSAAQSVLARMRGDTLDLHVDSYLSIMATGLSVLAMQEKGKGSS